MEIREICNHEKDTIWDETKRFVNPQEIYVDLSQKLYDVETALFEQIRYGFLIAGNPALYPGEYISNSMCIKFQRM